MLGCDWTEVVSYVPGYCRLLMCTTPDFELQTQRQRAVAIQPLDSVDNVRRKRLAENSSCLRQVTSFGLSKDVSAKLATSMCVECKAIGESQHNHGNDRPTDQVVFEYGESMGIEFKKAE